jgi:hypothetical protein
MQKPDFRHANDKKQFAFNYLHAHFIDLMRHQLDDQNLQHTIASDLECTQFTLKIAHIVVEMSQAKRMGDLRRKAIVTESNEVIAIEIRAASEIRESYQSDMHLIEETDCPVFNKVLSRLRYAGLEDIDIHIANLKIRQEESTRNASIAMLHSGMNETSTSFIEEWRAIRKVGAHGGDKYVQYIRSNGSRLLRERATRDEHWFASSGEWIPSE